MKFISITPENNNASEFIEVTSKMPAFVKLYSPGCTYCIGMKGAWDKLNKHKSLKNYNMAIIEVHSDEIKNITSPSMQINGGFPTIRKVLISGNIGKDYDGNRSTNDMIKFIKQEFKETLVKGKKTRKGKMQSLKKVKKGKSKKPQKGKKQSVRKLKM